MRKYISFDVGGTKVKHGVLFENGDILTKGSYSTNGEDLEQFLSDLVGVVNEYTKQHEIEGVAISLPGFVNPKTGFTEMAGAITALHGKNLKVLLEERIRYRVEIENDGNCSAFAEKWTGHAVDCDDFICFTIGTGIGGGIFVNGSVLHGHTFRGGEFGFMVTERTERGHQIMHLNASTSSLIRSFRKLKGLPSEADIHGEEVFEEANTNEGVAQLLHDWYEHISVGIFNLACTFNPQKILIGGGVSAREDLLENVVQKLDGIEYWKYLHVPIDRCKHRNDAGLIGAVYHYQAQMGK